MKRFTDTDKWTKDRWFCELEPKHKLFWLYLIDQCDNVGVWEVNLKISTALIGYKYPIDTLLEVFAEKIYVFDEGRKWWIRSFIDFQHGELSEGSGSKPIQSYISSLKKHGLWIPYAKGIQRVQGKGKGKGEGKSKSAEVFYSAAFSEWWASYKVGSKKNAFDAWKKQDFSEADVEMLVAAADKYKAYCASVDRPMKDGQGWLNGRYWENEWTHEAQGTKPAKPDTSVAVSASKNPEDYTL